MKNKNIVFGWLLAIIQILALAAGNLPVFMCVFALGALHMGKVAKNIRQFNALCVTTCALSDIAYDSSCSIKGGLRTVYWARYSDIDWPAILAPHAPPALPTFDVPTQTVLGYIMIGNAKFNKLTFDRKSSFYNFTFTSDAELYSILMTIIFEGKSAANRQAFTNAVSCCDIVAHIFDNNCKERIIGVEYNGTSFEPQITKLRITRHLDSSGQFGTDKARDELDLGGESLTTPLFANVGELNIPQ